MLLGLIANFGLLALFASLGAGFAFVVSNFSGNRTEKKITKTNKAAL